MKRTGEVTWVPVYVEQAICDLIPDTGFDRENARLAWLWDDEHPEHKNAIYHWQNIAIQQRVELIALRAHIEYEKDVKESK